MDPNTLHFQLLTRIAEALDDLVDAQHRGNELLEGINTTLDDLVTSLDERNQ